MKFEFLSSIGPRVNYVADVSLDEGDKLSVIATTISVWIPLKGPDGIEHEVDIWPSYEHGVYLGPATRDDILRDIEEHLAKNRELVKSEHIALWGERYPFAD